MASEQNREDRLCLLLAQRRVPSDSKAEVVSLLASGCNWRFLVDQCIRHEIYPLVFRNLRDLGSPFVPEDVISELEALYRVNSFQNLHLADELTGMLKLLGQADIPVIPLKGLALATYLYDDPAMRVCVDTDILVPISMVTRAADVLMANGYEVDDIDHLLSDLRQENTNEYPLMKDLLTGKHRLELHWSLLWGLEQDRPAVEDLWAEARTQQFQGVGAYKMSPEWELLFLAAHASHHGCDGLKWLVDIHEFCVRERIDWDRVRAKSTRFGWSRMVKMSLSAAHMLYSTPIPEDLCKAKLPSWVKLFPGRSSKVWPTRLYPLQDLRGVNRLRYLAHVLLLPTHGERDLFRLPSRLQFLYYALRPLRLGLKCFRLVP